MLVGELTGAGDAVPPELDMGTFVSAIDTWADDSAVVIDHLSPTTARSATATSPGPADTNAVAVRIGARGGYEGLMAFIDALTASERIIVVDRVELRADEESNDVLLDLDVRIFTTEPLVPAATDGAGNPDDPTAEELDAAIAERLGGAEGLEDES